MAVTITQSPQLYTMSDNPVVWAFSSTQTTQPNFYFLVEVYIGGTLVERHRAYVENGTKAHYNAQAITERYCNVMDKDITFETNGNNYNTCYIKVLEVYGNPTVEYVGATSSTINVFKARLKRKDFVNYDYLDYYNTNPFSKEIKFLTLFPRGEKYKCGENEKVFLSILNTSAYRLVVRLYNSSSTVISSGFYDFTNGDKIKSFDFSKSSLLTNIPALDFTGVVYWELSFINPLQGDVSEYFFIHLDTDCIYPTKRRVHFLNSLGSYDSFTFGLVSREKTTVTSFGYEEQFGGFNDAGSYEFDINNGTNVDYIKQFDTTLELRSDWLTQGVQNWLVQELYTSPIVLLEEDGGLRRVKITNTSYEQKIQLNDMLFLETITLDLGSDNSVNV